MLCQLSWISPTIEQFCDCLEVTIPFHRLNIASWGNKWGNKWGDKKELPDNYEKVLGLIRNNPNIIKSQIAKELHIGKSMVDKAIESLSKIKTD